MQFRLPDLAGSSPTLPSVSTDANGIATAPSLTANNTPGNFSATAAAQGVAASAAFNLTVLPKATGTLQVLPAQINFAIESGQPAPAFQTVQIVNSDGRTEPWTSVSSAPWLTVSPSAGATPASVNVTVDPYRIGAGLVQRHSHIYHPERTGCRSSWSSRLPPNRRSWRRRPPCCSWACSRERLPRKRFP